MDQQNRVYNRIFLHSSCTDYVFFTPPIILLAHILSVDRGKSQSGKRNEKKNHDFLLRRRGNRIWRGMPHMFRTIGILILHWWRALHVWMHQSIAILDHCPITTSQYPILCLLFLPDRRHVLRPNPKTSKGGQELPIIPVWESTFYLPPPQKSIHIYKTTSLRVQRTFSRCPPSRQE